MATYRAFGLPFFAHYGLECNLRRRPWKHFRRDSAERRLEVEGGSLYQRASEKRLEHSRLPLVPAYDPLPKRGFACRRGIARTVRCPDRLQTGLGFHRVALLTDEARRHRTYRCCHSRCRTAVPPAACPGSTHASPDSSCILGWGPHGAGR